MSFAGFEDDIGGWGAPVELPTTGDIVKDAMRKEQVIKEITAAQEDLRALLSRVKSVQADVDKLASGNATLQTYIDNLTLQMAKRR
ncbi:hypothetical protein GLOTRDRAFT_77237 [Gloeophyllum trabeum ATCC 11539]|uniref:Uncharacterized protein n=1 Tax=Gloeophyllum trabeum (strain ATCC 11539 / FP-39264 / Madison 617) TaxID=670483 RepID=S7Q527_GLOTA|nr:uncharacterized protein GLOTRDRAFT_77237 [Gloeophyllum trabeum ATCC 11539]EPQ54618.1 hypothetical protein GLOTRDRAFT_77237 [Gloeophyllum trabeum ATCC 11539]